MDDNQSMKPMIYKPERQIELLHRGEYKGYEFIIMSLGTHPTAYVNLPKGHLFCGLDEDELMEVPAHGGITYAGDAVRISKDEYVNGNWIGWDYSHSGDYLGYDKKYGTVRDSKKWTTEEIYEEVKEVIDYLDRVRVPEAVKIEVTREYMTYLFSIGRKRNVVRGIPKDYIFTGMHPSKDRDSFFLCFKSPAAQEGINYELYEIKEESQMRKFEEMDLYVKAWNKWGWPLQSVMLIEECAELQKAVTKILRGMKKRSDYEGIIEELADVEIMIRQVKYGLGIEFEVEEMIDRKLVRLKRMLEEG